MLNTTKQCEIYELAIFYDEDEELIETHEYDSKEEMADILRDLLIYYKNYTKMEISLIKKEIYVDDGWEDNIESELLFTITNNRENKGE
jgi:hypothetical protein